MSAVHDRRLLTPGVLGVFVVGVCVIVMGLAVMEGWRPDGGHAVTATEVTPRLESARILEKSGEFFAAREQLAPLLREPGVPGFRAARWLSWRMDWAQTFSLARDNPRWPRARRQLVRQTAALIAFGGWNRAQWRALAHGALALGRLPLAARAWTFAGHGDPAAAIHDEYRVAQVWAADGQTRRAGRLCLRLAGRAQGAGRRGRLFRQGVAYLEGSEGAVKALAQAQRALKRIASWPADRAIVLCVARTAMAAGRPGIAASVLTLALRFQEAP